MRDLSDSELANKIRRATVSNVIVDGLQEIQRRVKYKTKFFHFLDLHELNYLQPVKCFISNKWLPRDLSTQYRIFNSKGSYEVVYCKFEVPDNEFYRDVLPLGDYLAWRDQDFIEINTGLVVSGKQIDYTIASRYVPKIYFDIYFIRADCGHVCEKVLIKEGLCRACLIKISPTGILINDYSCRAPKYLPFQDGDEKRGKYSGSTLYFGVELELENGHEREAILFYKELKDYLLCKNDGSLTKGIEIITAPAVFSVHKKKAEQLFTIIEKQTSMLAKTNCGLHFHVSKNALTTMQIGKIVEFVNNPKNIEFIKLIAGRGQNSYSKLGDKKITDLAPENFSRDSAERYDAVNLRNVDTIEFRIFASTTKYDVFMSRLEFVKALIDYTKPCAVNVKNLTELKDHNTFLNFVKENKKEYPYLASYLDLTKPKPTYEEIQLKKGPK